MRAALLSGALVLAVLAATSGCDDTAETASTVRHQTLTVLAASSLTGTFTDLAAQFEAEHPHVDVKLVFDSSATLAHQAAEHAPGDILATADEQTMDQAKSGGGLGGEPIQFATNVMTLAVPKDNPAHIRRLADLDKGNVDYLTCVRTAPCGAAAKALLAADRVKRKPVSEEVDVKSVLAKVEAGEADAGLVYQTDVTASAGKVTGIEVPGAAERPNTYWVAVTAEAKGDPLAEDWVTFLTGTEAQAVLKAAGFGTSG
jgi:molybdate transport system substrate-binding protein